jgi:hypothetical protein
MACLAAEWLTLTSFPLCPASTSMEAAVAIGDQLVGQVLREAIGGQS